MQNESKERGSIILPDAESIRAINRDMYQLNMGYLVLMRNYSDRDMVMARRVFKEVPDDVLGRMSEIPPQRLAEIAKSITIPVVHTGINETAWKMVAGVIENQVKPSDLYEYLLSVMIHGR